MQVGLVIIIIEIILLTYMICVFTSYCRSDF